MLDLEKINSDHPVIHNFSNYVTMDFNANILLALGASPIMAHAEEELEELLTIARALVVNIGTLDKFWINSMKAAITLAKDIPLILDPVGAGASKLRTHTALDFLATQKISVLRGNAGEILALSGAAITSRGVDSNYQTNAAVNAAQLLAEKFNCIVVVSGETDLIVNSSEIKEIQGGNPMMTQVTGMGCSASCVVGAFCAVNNDRFSAAMHAMQLMKIAGEMAAKTAKASGSFKTAFIDAIFNLSQQSILEYAV